MKKKIASLLVFLLTAALVFPAAGAKSKTWSGQCGPELYWEMSGSTATITGQGEMWDYTTWNYCHYPETPFKQHNLYVREAELPEGLTSIGNELFRNCIALEKFNIPTTVTRIGDYSFTYCGRYARDCAFTLPSGLIYLGNGAFLGCEGLSCEDFTLPSDLRYLGSNAFSECSGLKADGLSIPTGISEIEYAAFRNCRGLTGDLYIHARVTRIDSSAFEGTGFDSVYFYGDAPAGYQPNGTYDVGLPKGAVLYYPADADGWTNSEYYDPEAGTWNGYELRPWTPNKVTLHAELNENVAAVTVSNWRKYAVDGKICCAAYTDEGKMLSIDCQDVELATMENTEMEVPLSCVLDQVEYIKVFCLTEYAEPYVVPVELYL